MKYSEYAFSLIRREIGRQAIYFGIIGLTSMVVTYGIFYILLKLGVYYMISSGIGYLGGMTFTFMLNRKYTFKSKEKFRRSFLVYAGVYLSSMILGLALLYVLVQLFYISVLPANLIMTIFTAVTNFFGTKLLAFNNKEW